MEKESRSRPPRRDTKRYDSEDSYDDRKRRRSPESRPRRRGNDDDRRERRADDRSHHHRDSRRYDDRRQDDRRDRHRDHDRRDYGSSRRDSRDRRSRDKRRIDKNLDFSSDGSDHSPRDRNDRERKDKSHSNFDRKERSPRDHKNFDHCDPRDKKRDKRSRSRSSRGSSGSKSDKDDQDNAKPIEKEKPCFAPSGILAEYSNKLNGIVLKFTEPIDAAPPSLETWGLYPFNGGEVLKSVTLRTVDGLTSAFLLGRDEKVAHVHLDHHTCSGQHAVIQFRKKLKVVELTAEEQLARGTFEAFMQEFTIVPYLMDLESTNGTSLNGEKVDGAKYIELRSKDCLKFGTCEIEYVFMKQKDSDD